MTESLTDTVIGGEIGASLVLLALLVRFAVKEIRRIHAPVRAMEAEQITALRRASAVMREQAAAAVTERRQVCWPPAIVLQVAKSLEASAAWPGGSRRAATRVAQVFLGEEQTAGHRHPRLTNDQ